ncbi:hypothetical protein B484DRAFT_339366, partial [Ochromonadaceae sp. CCMP2298]
ISAASATALAQNCPALQKLVLTSCKHNPDLWIVAFSQHCPGLRDLTGDNGNFSDVSLTALARNCRGLEKVNLESSGRVTDRGITELAQNFAGLQLLYASDCKISKLR